MLAPQSTNHRWSRQVATYQSADRSAHSKFVSLATEALAEEVRHLDENRSAVAAEAGNNLSGEGVCFSVVEIVVVADVKGGAGTRRPASKELRAQT